MTKTTISNNQPIRLIVGLGNPGSIYQETRHNIGQRFTRLLADKLNAPGFKTASSGAYQKLTLPSQQQLFFFESTKYMNECGAGIARFAKYYKIAPNQILIAYDEMDLTPGSMRLKLGGGSAGHNGIKDCLLHLPSEDFVRLRVGIGRNAHGESSNYVLSSPNRDQLEKIDSIIDEACNYAELILQGHWDTFMNKLHCINYGR